MKKGFTLVELIVVIAIVAIAGGLIGTQFFKSIKSQDEFEDKVVGRDIADAAYVFIDSKDNKNADGSRNLDYGSCNGADILIEKGYIADEQGLLKKIEEDDLKKFGFKVTKDGEKKVTVYKSNNPFDKYNDCVSDNIIEY